MYLILFHCFEWEHVQFYFFYLKERENAKKGGKEKKEASVHDTAALQNIYPSAYGRNV